MSDPNRTPSLSGKRHVMQVKDDSPRHAWVFFQKHKWGSGDAFRKFSSDTRTDGKYLKVEIVRSNNGGGGGGPWWFWGSMQTALNRA